MQSRSSVRCGCALSPEKHANNNNNINDDDDDDDDDYHLFYYDDNDDDDDDDDNLIAAITVAFCSRSCVVRLVVRRGLLGRALRTLKWWWHRRRKLLHRIGPF